DRSDALKLELATLTEWSNSLSTLNDVAAEGTQLLEKATATGQTLAVLTSRQRALSGLSAQLVVYSNRLGVPGPETGTRLGEIVDNLLSETPRRETAFGAAQAEYNAASNELDELVRLNSDLVAAINRSEKAKANEIDVTRRRI